MTESFIHWNGAGYYVLALNNSNSIKKYYFVGADLSGAQDNLNYFAYEGKPVYFSNKRGLTWKNVFDCEKCKWSKNTSTIYDANMFVKELGYSYFAWNDKVYKVQNPFDLDECDVDVLVSEL